MKNEIANKTIKVLSVGRYFQEELPNGKYHIKRQIFVEINNKNYTLYSDEVIDREFKLPEDRKFLLNGMIVDVKDLFTLANEGYKQFQFDLAFSTFGKREKKKMEIVRSSHFMPFMTQFYQKIVVMERLIPEPKE